MQTALLRWLIALVTVALAGAASAHLGEMVYPIYELPTSDLPNLHDGTLEDWEEALPAASLNHNDFAYSSNLEKAVGVEDLAFRVFLAWHSASQQIYMGIECVDDVYLTSGNGYTDLMIDGDHSGGQYWFFEAEGYSEEESKRLFGSQAQTYKVMPEEVGGRLLHVSSWATWASDPPWADAGGFQYGDSPNLSVVELAITAWDDLNWVGPESSRRSALEAGRIVGFNIRVTDFDVADVPDGSYILAMPTVSGEIGDPSSTHQGFAENFVDGELVPCFRGDCSGATTAVQMNSWGRIKASFR